MKPLTLDELRELAPGFVMGTLTADELERFGDAMADPTLAADLAPEIEAHRAAVEFLATERAVAPPLELKARVMSRIAAEPMTRAVDAPVLELLSSTPKGGRAPTPQRVVVHPPQQLVRKPSNAAWWGMGATTLAMAASAIFAVDLNNQVNTLSSTVQEQAMLIKRNEARLASRDETMRILTEGGNDLVLVQLAANKSTGPGMQVFWNVKQGTAVVHASGFKQVAANRTYCLWLIRDGKPVAVKLFNPNADGQQLISGVEVPKDTQGIAAFAVTEEPAEGSPQPTMTPFLVGAVSTK